MPCRKVSVYLPANVRLGRVPQRMAPLRAACRRCYRRFRRSWAGSSRPCVTLCPGKARMTRPCPGARAVTSRPIWQPPANGTDCHCHVFGPYDRYPLSPGRSYTPPEASIAQYLEMLDSIGLRRTVIVQPSIYGTENAVTLDAVEAIGLDRARAVVVVDDRFDTARLEAMASRGACGVRF